jgi:hypothetical protein
MARVLQKDATSKTIYVLIRGKATTPVGMGLTGLAFNTAGLVFSYTRALAVRTAITLATQTVTGAYSSGGFVEVDATNQPGLYRLDLPNAAIATGVDEVTITWTGANTVDDGVSITLVGYDPIAAGLTAAQIATEVLVTQTQAELAALPGTGAVSLFSMLRYLYQRARHKRTVTATEDKMYKADGATVLSTEGLSDDTTTFTKGAGA